MPRDLQTAFSAGELDPALHSHSDLQKHQTGLAILENYFCRAQGGISNRAGFEYINQVLNDEAGRLIDFSFNTEQAYALIFTDQKMRVARNGGMVLEPNVVIIGATQANPVVVTAPGHGYNDGDDIFIDSIVGMTELNGRFFKVTAVTAGTYTLSGIDGTGYGAYVSGGEGGRVYTLDTPYAVADLFRLKYTQSADVMTITHPDYADYDLSRVDHDDWTIAANTYASDMSPPSAGLGIAQTGTPSGADPKTYRYVITSVNSEGDESVASSIVTSGSIAALSETYGNRLSWTTVADATYYNVFKEFSYLSGIFGWIGEADEDGSPSFDDYNFGPDMSFTPPIANDPFAGADNKPACVEYYQQRRWFGGTNNNRQSIFATRTADFDNMDVSRPSRADDAISLTIAAQQVNEIRHLVSLDDLIAITSGGVWKLEADQDGVLTPANINPRRQAGSRGGSHVRPIVIGETALYVQEKGNRIRDLMYTFDIDRYSGNDITILSRHMFEGYEIVDACYAQEPYSIVWAVRNDGVLLSLTYLREHNVYAWARHVTDGEFESVCAVSEGDQDVVYAIVKRMVNGSEVRYIERMHERIDDVIEDAFFVDSGLTYDGAATNVITNLHHLEGESVVALADGNVYENLVVSDGSVTLPDQVTASKVHVGLGYDCDWQNLEFGRGTQSRKKQVDNVYLRVLKTRGLAVGRDADSVREIKERRSSDAYENIPGQTAQQKISVKTGWNDYGQVYCRQRYPLPATILAVIPEVDVSG